MTLTRPMAVLFAGLGMLPLSAAADPVLARYEVYAAGFTAMRVEALFELEGPRYLVRTRIRMSGMIGALASGDQVTEAAGRWNGVDPQPERYRVSGAWRGSPRVVEIDWAANGEPRVGALVPGNAGEREEVPEALRQGTMDSLSALAKLTRVVAETGRCDTEAAVYDGRRRADYSVRSASIDLLPREGGFAGEALRCAFESRVLAGFRGDQDPEEARKPQPATAWLARPVAGLGPVPVRIELPSRWFGTIRVVLVGVERATPSAQQVTEQRR